MPELPQAEPGDYRGPGRERGQGGGVPDVLPEGEPWRAVIPMSATTHCKGQAYALWCQRNPDTSRLTELWPGGPCAADLLYASAKPGDRERVQQLVHEMILGGQP